MNAKLTGIITIFLALIISNAFAADGGLSNHRSPLGFEFGSSHKDVQRRIEDSGHQIIEDVKDSKKIRTILADGAFVQLPINTDSYDLRTRFEFWDKDLISASLLVEEGSAGFAVNKLLDYLMDHYGKPTSSDKFMDFTTFTWQLSDLSIVLSSNAKKNRTKLEFTYTSLNAERNNDRYDHSQRVKGSGPAEKMFLEGGLDVSKQYRDR